LCAAEHVRYKRYKVEVIGRPGSLGYCRPDQTYLQMIRIFTKQLRLALVTNLRSTIGAKAKRAWRVAVRSLTSLALIGVFVATAGASQSEWSAESLMMKLAEVKQATLSFVEYRSSIFLVGKVKLTGHMTYRAPDFILKSVETPFVENIEIEGDRISIEKVTNRGESTFQQYSITRSDVLSATIEGIRATISGDYSKLGENYEILVTGDMNEWIVTLIPRRQELLDHIEKIAVSGSQGEIRMIETFNADGDETSLNLSYLTQS